MKNWKLNLLDTEIRVFGNKPIFNKTQKEYLEQNGFVYRELFRQYRKWVANMEVVLDLGKGAVYLYDCCRFCLPCEITNKNSQEVLKKLFKELHKNNIIK